MRIGVTSSPAEVSSSISASAKPAGALVAVMRMAPASESESAEPEPEPESAEPPRGSGMLIGSPGVSHFDVEAPPARTCT